MSEDVSCCFPQFKTSWCFRWENDTAGISHFSPGSKIGTWKSLGVQGFMVDPDSIGILKEIKLGCHDGNFG